MKILFATSSFMGGGITSYGKEVISNFSEGNDFSVLIGDDSRSPITTPGVKVYKYFGHDISLRNALNIINLINNEIKPEVILCSNARVISLVAPYLNDNIKIVTVSHSLKYMEADMAAISHKYIDRIIGASSQYNKEYMEKRFHIKDKDKIKIVWNFVNEHPSAEEYRNKKKDNKPLSIVFTGGAAASKTPELVLKVLLELIKTDLPFDFYWTSGTYIPINKYFPFGVPRDLRELVPKDKRVHITGRLKTREEVQELFAKANIFFTPSRREGCPMSLIEVMRVGAISIVSDYKNANREIIKDGYNGFIIHHKDINGFVDRIRDIIENHEKYYDIYDNSYSTYLSELSFPVWKNKMNEVLNNIQLNHATRHKSVNKLSLFLHSLYFRWIYFRGRIEKTIEEDLKVIFALSKMKRYKY